MVDGLFFCATLTGRRGGHTQFVQAAAETADTSAEAVESDPGVSLSWGYFPLSGMKCGVLWDCPPTLHYVDNPTTAPYVCCCCQIN